MKAVRVTYTTMAEYAVHNQENIKTVMQDLRQLNHSGISYHVCLDSDGQTFTHHAYFRTEEDQKVLNDLASFRTFQSELKASLPQAPPKQVVVSVVGSVNSGFDSQFL